MAVAVKLSERDLHAAPFAHALFLDEAAARRHHDAHAEKAYFRTSAVLLDWPVSRLCTRILDQQLVGCDLLADALGLSDAQAGHAETLVQLAHAVLVHVAARKQGEEDKSNTHIANTHVGVQS